MPQKSLMARLSAVSWKAKHNVLYNQDQKAMFFYAGGKLRNEDASALGLSF